MELTETKIKNLLSEQIINQVSEETFKELLNISVSHICQKSETAALNSIYGSKPDIVKAAFTDISRLFVEAARHDTSSEELNSLLRCTALNKNFIDQFCEFYEEHKVKLQDSLESVGNGLPHIIDVDWRLDYCIKSNTNNPAGIINYHISLSTIKHGKIDSLKFMCTIQQLQELVYKLKDAVRHAEKLSNP